ncbi:MAG: hypothetical protein JW953_21205 [Anaerolineae bacterium]|nr:hypothetical protein [Anaerolineae bacterium]
MMASFSGGRFPGSSLFRGVKTEWRWAIGWTAAILLFSCVPYLVALLMAPEGWHFAGILVNPYDGQSYLAKMRQGFDGHWLFHLTYTPEPHQGAFIFTFYLALGHLARLAHLPLILVFHLARLLAGLILLLAAFRFVNLVTPHPSERRLAFILLCTASGLGWLGAIFNALPIDLWVPEAFVPYSLYANPHFPLAIALMLIILQIALWPPPVPGIKKQIFFFLLAGLAALVLALVLPFALLTTWAVLLVCLGWFYLNRRYLPLTQICFTLSVVVFAAPIIFYDYWVSIANPVLAGWSAQNVTPAPTLANLALGYGPVGLLAMVGGWMVIRGDDKVSNEWVVLWWTLTTLFLVYLPFFNLQRRLINGLHLPLCLLAAIGLTRWLAHSRLKPAQRRLVKNMVVTMGALGTLFVWSIPLLGMLQAPAESETTAKFFLQKQEILAFDWLRQHSGQNNIILASPRLGLFVPGQTGARAFYGHPFETIKATAKKDMVEAFYRGELKMVAPPPDFVIYGPSERALGRPQNLAQYPPVFAAGDVAVYQRGSP